MKFMTITSSNILILVIGATIVCSSIEATSFEDDADYGKEQGGDGSYSDFDNFEIAGFSVDVSHKYTVSKDKLKTVKSFTGYKVKSPYSANKTILTLKKISKERVESCAKYMLLKPEAKKLIDCRTEDELILDSLTPDIDLSSNTNGDSKDIAEKFVVLFSSIFIRETADEPVINYEYELFPLRKAVTKRNIKAILEANNFEKGFPSPTNFGFHIETFFKSERTGKRLVVCTAEVFLSMNTSKPLTFGPRPSKRVEDGFDMFLEAWNNGLILSIQNANCYMSGFTLFNLRSEITLIKKQDFPFLTGNIRLWFEPSETNSLLNFNATVSQQRTSKHSNLKSGFPYRTEWNLHSSSALIPFMNIDSKKVSIHERDDQGVDDWIIGIIPYIVQVDSAWNTTISAITAKLSSFDPETIFALKKRDKEEVEKAMQKIGKLFYLDNSSDDNIMMNVRLEKAFIESLMGRNLSESLFNLLSSNDTAQASKSEQPKDRSEL